MCVYGLRNCICGRALCLRGNDNVNFVSDPISFYLLHKSLKWLSITIQNTTYPNSTVYQLITSIKQNYICRIHTLLTVSFYVRHRTNLNVIISTYTHFSENVTPYYIQKPTLNYGMLCFAHLKI